MITCKQLKWLWRNEIWVWDELRMAFLYRSAPGVTHDNLVMLAWAGSFIQLRLKDMYQV